MVMVTATYHPTDGSVISSFGASSNNSSVYVGLVKNWTATTIDVEVICMGMAGTSAVVTPWVRATNGETYSTSFTVNVN